MQAYALGKLFGRRFANTLETLLFRYRHSFESTAIGITTLSTKQKKRKKWLGSNQRLAFTSQLSGPSPDMRISISRELLLYQLSYTSCFCNRRTCTIISRIQFGTLLLELYCILKMMSPACVITSGNVTAIPLFHGDQPTYEIALSSSKLKYKRSLPLIRIAGSMVKPLWVSYL